MTTPCIPLSQGGILEDNSLYHVPPGQGVLKNFA